MIAGSAVKIPLPRSGCDLQPRVAVALRATLSVESNSPQPRRGCVLFHTYPQRSRRAATLGWRSQPLRGARVEGYGPGAAHPGNSKLWLPTFLLFYAIITLAGMKLLVYLAFLVLGILSVRRVRWAYVTFVLLGLLYFPASVGFRLNPQPCELIPNMALAVYSLGNYQHIVLFVFFFLMTSAQFRMSQWSGYAWAAVACIAMGILVEVAQGITGIHHCRLRDLIPDAGGVVLGAGIVLLWNRMRRRPQPT